MSLPNYVPSIRFEKFHPDAQLPKKNFDTDSGWDLFAVESVSIPPRTRLVVPVGLKLAYLYQMVVSDTKMSRMLLILLISQLFTTQEGSFMCYPQKQISI
jgi:hypothetical protein